MHESDTSPTRFHAPAAGATPERALEDVRLAMQRAGLLEDPAPPAALRWIETFLEAFGDRLSAPADAVPIVRALRAEAAVVPALETRLCGWPVMTGGSITVSVTVLLLVTPYIFHTATV